MSRRHVWTWETNLQIQVKAVDAEVQHSIIHAILDHFGIDAFVQLGKNSICIFCLLVLKTVKCH